MKKLLLAIPALLLAAAGLAVQDMDFPTPEPTKQHEWLQQLVGEWSASAEMNMGPGTEPMTMESSESVRAIGELWILAEGSGDMTGAPHTSLLTLGYDPAKEAFVGTWVDTMQTHLWVYRGELDEARKVLTLEAEGPGFPDPTETAQYRDVIELKSPDHKVLTSSVKGEDGEWTSFLRVDYRRKE